MGNHGRFRHDQDSPTQGDAGAAVRSPSSAPGSNSSDLPPPSDAPTLAPEGFGPDTPTILPLSSASPSDSPTLADGASPPPRGGAPTRAVRLPQLELEHGTILAGRYEILQTLGQGGMGAVYKARDLELDRMVALKVIRPDLAKNPAIIDRFKQELRLSQRVTHRNVIRIYDLGEGDGVKFITMEYIEGQDLRTLIHRRKKFPPEEAVAIMEQVCLALDAAHSVGVIHRDLKPSNIFITSRGAAKILDFGLARKTRNKIRETSSPEGEITLTPDEEHLTSPGEVLGTIAYMSPEQARRRTGHLH